MMTNDLDHLLESRARPAAVPDALMARIMADAVREQPRPFAFAPRENAPQKLTLWQAISDMFGGGGVLAGLATVACAGIYLGAVQPSMITSAAFALSGISAVDQLDFMPSIDALLVEE